MGRTDSFENTLMLGKIEGRKKKGTTKDEMVGWHHRLDGDEFEQALDVGDGQGRLAYCSPWATELDTTEQLNQTKNPNIITNHCEEFPHYISCLITIYL